VSLFHTTVVPAFTQKVEFPFAPWTLGVAEAEFAVRLTSTEHDSEADPHVLLAVQSDAGFGSEHAYLLFLRLTCFGDQDKRYHKQSASDNKALKEPHNLPRLDSQNYPAD
jgi:hypothetical protein